MVEKAFKEKGRKWIDWRTRVHRMILNQRTLVCSGPHQAMEFDHLDEAIYMISARWRREKPYIPKTLDEAHMLATTMPSDSQPASLAAIYAQAGNTPDVEGMTRLKVDAAKRTGNAVKSWQKMDAERRSHGLPEFKYTLEEPNG